MMRVGSAADVPDGETNAVNVVAIGREVEASIEDPILVDELAAA